MKKHEVAITISLAAFLIICNSRVTLAKPGYGVSCGKSGCHTSNKNAMTVIEHDTNTDLGLGALKTYIASPGNTVHLSVNVTNGQNKYAVAIIDMHKAGMQNPSNTLLFTQESSWSDKTTLNPPYYVSSSSGHSWSGSTTKRTFQITIDPQTPSDYYLLEFETAGKNGGKWAQSESFYLKVLPGTPQPGDGDINKDGIVDMQDYSLLMMQWYNTECGSENEYCYGADIDVDGDVDIDDLMVIAMNWLMRKPLAVSVAHGNDDAEESVTDAIVSLTSSDLELTNDTQDQLVAIRFNNIRIEPGEDIANAYIQFTVEETTSGPAALVIEGQAQSNPPAFTAASGHISSRPVTSNFVEWSPPDWNTLGENGPDQQTPNLKSIIEEIINMPTWQTGNSIVFIISGNGKRVAHSYDGSPASAPTLHVDFQ